jgi:hypothetical protein
MKSSFISNLARLAGAHCDVVDAVEYETPVSDDIYAIGTSLRFSDGTRVSAQFWRLIKSDLPLVSIFDHRQKYGLPAPVDAIGMLRDELVGAQVVEASQCEATGDLSIGFQGGLILQVFNFTAFEIWEVVFPDGTGQLSNYCLE